MAPTKGITLCSVPVYIKEEATEFKPHPLEARRMKEQKRLWYRKKKCYGC